jgi:hypothetical protein
VLAQRLKKVPVCPVPLVATLIQLDAVYSLLHDTRPHLQYRQDVVAAAGHCLQLYGSLEQVII